MHQSTSRARRPNHAGPEVWFRIVHVASNKSDVFLDDAQQTVEVTLGPHGAFEIGVGRVTRQMPELLGPAGLTAVQAPKTPHIVELLRKAVAWREELGGGLIASQSEIARREGVTVARVTQILNLLRLAPEIQATILDLSPARGRTAISEHRLRPLLREASLPHQMAAFSLLLRKPSERPQHNGQQPKPDLRPASGRTSEGFALPISRR